MTTTPINGLRKPAEDDSPDGPLQIGNLADDLDTRLCPRFATTAARAAAIPSPIEGQLCYVSAQVSPAVAGRLMLYKNGSWRLVGPSPLTTISGPWTEPAGDFNPGGSTQTITSLTVPDPGFPYVLQIVTAGEIGSTAAGTRWDLQQVVAGSTNYTHDSTIGVDGQITLQRITSGVGATPLTGACTVSIVAFRAYGTAAGHVTGLNRRFTASVFGAA